MTFEFQSAAKRKSWLRERIFHIGQVAPDLNRGDLPGSKSADRDLPRSTRSPRTIHFSRRANLQRPQVTWHFLGRSSHTLSYSRRGVSRPGWL